MSPLCGVADRAVGVGTIDIGDNNQAEANARARYSGISGRKPT